MVQWKIAKLENPFYFAKFVNRTRSIWFFFLALYWWKIARLENACYYTNMEYHDVMGKCCGSKLLLFNTVILFNGFFIESVQACYYLVMRSSSLQCYITTILLPYINPLQGIYWHVKCCLKAFDVSTVTWLRTQISYSYSSDLKVLFTVLFSGIHIIALTIKEAIMLKHLPKFKVTILHMKRSEIDWVYFETL